ncbi:MAG: transporter substrate-binding domain-containing protein [Flavobacteriales bacterium]|nr:transporter substrate-binding domain-containing protein [Flavobacteriales bacterium]MCL4856483.1 transporter substrate-binding domain-containing protein [Flavobacteriales bacterium]
MLKSISYYLSVVIVVFLSSCADDDYIEPIYRDLDTIQTEGKLRALIHYSSTSYFIYKGVPQGFEYELLSLYADHIGTTLEVVPIKSLDSVFIELNKGTADIAAANLTVTEERKEQVYFTHPVLITKQVLIQRKPANWKKLKKKQVEDSLVRSVHELAGKKIVVREHSSFFKELKRIEKEIKQDIEIEFVPGSFTSEDLIEMVAVGEKEYTVADKNIAMVNEWYYPNIDAKMVLSKHQDIAWAIRNNSDSLLVSVNKWLGEFQKTKKFKSLLNKYFKNQHLVKNRVKHQYYTLSSGQISMYDELIKKHAPSIGWDWELLAALIYQESHFNNAARGWGDSFGLMQFMPETGARFGVDFSSGPEQNIIAGTKYIAKLNAIWEPEVEDKEERIKFILASYNAGPGHVIDAKNLAVKYGKNPKLWSDVGYFLLNKSKRKYYNDDVVKHGYYKGFIAYDYVNEIMDRYHHYKNITEAP